MTDEKRLPVIHVPTVNGVVPDNGTYCFDEPLPIRTDGQRLATVEYVPRASVEVARCRTCEHWVSMNDVDFECYHDDGLRNAPDDGSGYCHLHPDNAATEPKSEG